MIVIKAIELDWIQNWKHIWLEVDSSLVLDCISQTFSCPLTTSILLV